MTGLQPITAENYLSVVSRTLWENLPQVIGSGLLFSVAATPAFITFSLGLLAPTVLLAVITVAPAWCALMAVDGAILRDEVGSLRQWISCFRQHGHAAAMLSMVLAFPTLVLLQLLPLLQRDQVPAVLWLAIGINLFVIALALALLLYAFPLLPDGHDSFDQLLRQAWTLAARYPLNTVGLLAMALLMLFAIAYLSLGLLLLLPAVYALFVAANYQLVQTPRNAARKV